MEMAVQARL